jgi:hypothetical protein
MNYSRRDINYCALSSIIYLIGIIGYLIDNFAFFSQVITLLNVLFLFKFKNKIPVLVLFIFIFFYTFTFNYFFVKGISISYWQDFQTVSALKVVLFSHSLFIYFLGNFVKSGLGSHDLDFRTFIKPNNSLFLFFLVACIYFLIFGIQGKSLLNGGLYSDQDSAFKSTLHEYFILVYFFLILFSRNSKLHKYILRILMLMYVGKTVIYGGRVEVIEIILLWFYLFYSFRNKVKFSTVLIITIIGLYGISIINNIRTNPIGFISGDDLYSFFDPISSLSLNTNKEVISSNEGDVIQSSARIVGLIETNELTFFHRIMGGGVYILSPVLPALITPDFANLSTYKQEIYRSGGGSLISIYFYSWFSYFGPIFIALFISFIINQLYFNKSIYYFIYCTSILIMFPRWFAYNPIMLVKFCFYSLFVIFFIIKILKCDIQIKNNSL